METTGSGDSWGDKMNKPMLSNTLNKSKKGRVEGREERGEREAKNPWQSKVPLN